MLAGGRRAKTGSTKDKYKVEDGSKERGNTTDFEPKLLRACDGVQAVSMLLLRLYADTISA